MFLARAQGWLPDSVKLSETASATDSISALRRGEAHGAALTLDEALRVRAEGVPLKIVLVFDISMGADVLLSRPTIRRPEALRGCRIGLEDSALGALMLALVLERAGLRIDEVTRVSLPIDQQAAAWHKGEIDALITYEPTATRLLEAGARRLIDSREFPERIFDVLAVRSDLSRRQEGALRQLVAGHFKALRHLQSNPQDSYYRLASRLELPAHAVPEALHGLTLPGIAYNRALLAERGGLAQAAALLGKILQQGGLLGNPAVPEGFIDGRYLPAERA